MRLSKLIAPLSLIILTGCGASTTNSLEENTSHETPRIEAPLTVASSSPTTGTGKASDFVPSGDFATDVESMGVIADDMKDYEMFIADTVCESDTEPYLDEFSPLVMEVKGLLQSDIHPNVLRAAAEYNCSYRINDLEKAFESVEDYY